MQTLVVHLSLAILLLLAQAVAAEQPAMRSTAATRAKKLEQKIEADGKAGVQSPASTITATEAQATDPHGAQPLDDPLTCLARAIYWETRGEDDTSMQAVANVVLNRLSHDGFPKTVCEVVKQGGEQGSCEFSWWCDGRADEASAEAPYMRAKEIARRALNGALHDVTGGALYFHHRRVDPPWAKAYIKLTRVGEHIFYKPADGKVR